MGREEWVLRQWRSLCADLGVETESAERWGRNIKHAYSEEGRHYHTLEHLADMLEAAERDFDGLQHRRLVHLSIFFHDLVYDPKSGTNEEDSVVLFRRFSDAVGLNPSDASTVSDYIIATKQHNVNSSDDHDLRAFIDLDMAVIGRERSAYLTYASQIREEYIHVPIEVYCRKRAQILTDFLATDSIFATETYRRELEETARANVEAEVACSAQGMYLDNQREGLLIRLASLSLVARVNSENTEKSWL